MATVEIRRRKVCGDCKGSGVILNDEPTPIKSKWFRRLGLNYTPGIEFSAAPMYTLEAEYNHPTVSSALWAVNYGETVVSNHLWNDDAMELAEDYNDRLRHDLESEYPCRRCKAAGTVPAPLPRDEQMYDRGELMMEAFASGGMQSYNDMADDFGEYVSGTGAYADPIQQAIDRAWADRFPSRDDEWEG